jgi:hypothetical protein
VKSASPSKQSNSRRKNGLAYFERKPMFEILEALDKIVEYMEKDERKDWEECGKPDNHIYNSVVIVRDFLESIYKWVDER